MNTIMNILFVLLAAAMTYAIIVRLFFHGTYREPEGRALSCFVNACRVAGRLQAVGYLGWIEELLYRVKFDRVEFRRAVEMFRRRAEWCHAELKIFGSQATALGMLFTLVSLTTAATGTLDPTVVIAIGVMSSVYGLVIAIPGTMLHDIFQRRVDRFLDQADAILEALDGDPDAPVIATVPASPVSPTVSTRDVPPDQRHVNASRGRNKPRNVRQFEAADTNDSAAKRGLIHQGLITKHVDAYEPIDDNFNEQALEWLSEDIQGEVIQND
jgi:hypothetical protein